MALALLILIEVVIYLAYRQQILELLRPIFRSDVTNPENEVLGALIVTAAVMFANGVLIVGTRLLDAWFIRGSKIRLTHAAAEGLDWLLGAPTRWGPRRGSTDRRIANTAEGVLAVLSTPPERIQPSMLTTLAESQAFLRSSGTTNGLPSVTLQIPTVHCTAMGLFALDRLASARILAPSTSDAAFTQQLQEALINSASDDGWGFACVPPVPESQVRLFSTLWALRALNRSPFGAGRRFEEISLRLARRVPNGQFGFTYQDPTSRLAISSLYLLFLSEIVDLSLRRELTAWPRMESLIEFVIARLRKGQFLEVEEYESKGSGAEKLSWVHVSGALALQALAACYERLTSKQAVNLRIAWKRAMVVHWQAQGYFLLETDSDVGNPQTFPTAYYVAALNSYLERLTAGRNRSLKWNEQFQRSA